jgi:hypothetical protein|tara:strand:+ start:360 stop:536 length:177 start_codon:yes stop_codon:yes gene_type:complete
MSDPNMVKNIIDKKFTKANHQFTDMMRNKIYQAVDDFKKGFKYVTHDKVPETKDTTDG